MTELAWLSSARAGLPRFPGATLPEQLAVGRAAALEVLRRYRPGLAYDVEGAELVLRKVEVWEERHRKELEAVMMDPRAETLPEAIRLAMGSDVAQAWIIAGFTRAAAGLGPWLSGAVEREAAKGDLVQVRWAREDAEYRLQVFGAIVKMEQDGYLRTVFMPPGATAGLALGVAPVVVWAVVVAVVLIAAVVLTYYYSSRRLADNNRLMRDICQRAQDEGDVETVKLCIEATKELQAESMIPGGKEAIVRVATILAIGAVAYAALRWGPELWQKAKAH